MKLSLRRALVVSLVGHLGLVLMPGFEGLGGGPVSTESGYIPIAFMTGEQEAESSPSSIAPSAGGQANPAPEAAPEPIPEPIPDPIQPETEVLEPGAEATPVQTEGQEQSQEAPGTEATAVGMIDSPSDSGAATSGRSGVTGGGNAYQPPRLRVGALPLTAEESVEFPESQEIPVRLHVTRDGRVDQVQPGRKDLDPRLLKAVERAVTAMRFTPARRGNETVDAWFEMSFSYK